MGEKFWQNKKIPIFALPITIDNQFFIKISLL